MGKLPKNIYAIGDIHGMAVDLMSLLQAIKEDVESCGATFEVVFLGDLIDRGPASAQVLDVARDVMARVPGSLMLLGNHDQALLRILSGEDLTEDEFDVWWFGGGQETMESYRRPDAVNTTELMREHVLRLYPRHIELLRCARLHHVVGDYVMVHAGIRPGVPLASQSTKDLVSIRRAFLEHDGVFEKIVVHGHSITKSFLPEVHGSRIAVDTGAYRSGRLTALVIEDETATRFISTYQGDGPRRIEHRTLEECRVHP